MMNAPRYIFLSNVLSLFFGFTLLIHTSEAAFIYATAGSTYTQDFNHNPSDNSGLAASGSNLSWIDDTTIKGWYSNLGRYTADNGNAGAALYSYGSTGSNERALGALAGGSDIQFGIQLQNTTGTTLTRFDLAYVGEQWRNSGSTFSNVLSFDYRIDTTAGLNPTAGTSVAALNFTSLHISSAGGDIVGPLDGNLAINQTAISTTVSGINWAPNQFLLLRWTDSPAQLSNHGLAIDNVVFSATAVPEPSSLVLLCVAFCGLLFVRPVRRRLVGPGASID